MTDVSTGGSAPIDLDAIEAHAKSRVGANAHVKATWSPEMADRLRAEQDLALVAAVRSRDTELAALREAVADVREFTEEPVGQPDDPEFDTFITGYTEAQQFVRIILDTVGVRAHRPEGDNP